MRIYFLRHGPALSQSEWAESDDTRPLSEQGEVVVRAVAKRMAELDLGIDVIVTSPFTRAAETARPVLEALGGTVSFLEDSGLEPGAFDLAALTELVKRHTDAKGLVVVGHEPSMSDTLSQLIGGGRIVLKKAALARADVLTPEPLTGELRWLITPALLR